MRRSTLTVLMLMLVLILMPSSAWACFDEHKAGWFE